MHTHHTEHRHGEGETNWAELAEVLDLDAEVFGGYLAEATGWVRELAGDQPGGRVLDLGAGTGSGTFALAECFGSAELIAVDASADLLGRLEAKARQLGLADRISTRLADLDAGWPDVGLVDVAWACRSMHHLADPDRVLREVFGSIRPGGFLAVAEMESFPRFLPDDIGLGRPGLESRCHAALAEQTAHSLPHLGADWGSRLRQAGFSLVDERRSEVSPPPPLPASAGRFALATLRRLRPGVGDRLEADDLAILDRLIDADGPDSVARRDDLFVRTVRTGWVARRP